MSKGAKPKMNASQRWVMLSVILGSGIVFLDSTVINVALPQLGTDVPRLFLGRLEAQSYVYNSYLLALSALLIIAGALNDRFGRRRMFLVGLSGFGFTSLLCGLSWNMEVLVLFRVLQGASGAVLVPSSLALIRASFSGPAQGRAFGLWAGASGATTILGPVLGGFLVDAVSWRAVFLLNLPLVALGIYATARHVTESKDPDAVASIDWLGAVVVLLAVGGLSLGAIRGQERQWEDPVAFVSIAVGAVSAVIFPFLMKHKKDPLVPLHLFKSRNFAVTNISTFLIYGALYVGFFFITLFLQGSLGYSATGAGVALIPTSAFLALFSSRFGAIAARRGPMVFMVAGPVIMALSFIYLSYISSQSLAWRLDATNSSTYIPPVSYVTDILPGAVGFGVGLTMMVAPLTMALMTSVHERHSGVASAVNNAISRVGPQLASAFIFVAITASFYSGMGERLPEVDTTSRRFRQEVTPLNPVVGDASPRLRAAARSQSTEAFQIAMLVAAGLLFSGAAVNLAIRNKDAISSNESPT
ncbi:MAG TPA: MFS transporter [Actinomycetota bacterium]|nr:MFS transporter [Actinomycetota bacterium]